MKMITTLCHGKHENCKRNIGSYPQTLSQTLLLQCWCQLISHSTDHPFQPQREEECHQLRMWWQMWYKMRRIANQPTIWWNYCKCTINMGISPCKYCRKWPNNPLYQNNCQCAQYQYVHHASIQRRLGGHGKGKCWKHQMTMRNQQNPGKSSWLINFYPHCLAW